MAKHSAVPLPTHLRYLEPILRSLEKLRPDQINEDLDLSEVEQVLRKRIKGLDRTSISRELEDDRVAFEEWLSRENRPDYPGYWLLGVLSSPQLADGLTRAPKPPPSAPIIHFEAPVGWTVKPVPFALNMKYGKLIAVIGSIQSAHFNLFMRKKEASLKPPIVAQLKMQNINTQCTDVKFGDSIGKKYVVNQTAPIQWKRVEYVLTVSGGHVSVMIDGSGSDFDESPIESKLQTIRIT